MGYKLIISPNMTDFGFIYHKSPVMLSFQPINEDIETKVVLRNTAMANKALAELKGVIGTIPTKTSYLKHLRLERREKVMLLRILSADLMRSIRLKIPDNSCFSFL